jgi:RNA polymerase sigma-70 factor, ECF subfamily
MSSHQPEISLARAIPSSAGDRMSGGRSIRSEVYSPIPLLRALALVRTRNQTAADDLVEATLRLAVARRNQLPDGGNLTAWLLAIQRAIFSSDSYKQSPPGSETSRDSGANWRTLHRALLQLPDTLCEALFLKVGAGYEDEEIAELVATDVGTVNCRAQKAMRRLVELLEVNNDSVVLIHSYLPHGNASESNAELRQSDRVCTNNLDNLIEYAHEKNISRYKLLLLETTDEKRRTVLQDLLSEEEAKMASNGRKPDFGSPLTPLLESSHDVIGSSLHASTPRFPIPA